MTHAPYVSTLIAPRDSEKLDQGLIDHACDALGASAHNWLCATEACDIFHSKEDARAALNQLLALEEIDHITQPVETRRKQLLISDMDSTMIEQECIDELAAYLGIKDKVSDITERAMNGELDFAEALRARVGLLKGLPQQALQVVYDEQIKLMAGARELVQTMRANGANCLLVSGGFTFFTQRVGDALGFHAHFANELAFENEELTGAVTEPILGAQAKLDTLNAQAVAPEHVLAVGDGANDLPMLLAAGLGVAYHAKPVVQAEAKANINYCDLSALLYAQGFSRADWVK